MCAIPPLTLPPMFNTRTSGKYAWYSVYSFPPCTVCVAVIVFGSFPSFYLVVVYICWVPHQTRLHALCCTDVRPSCYGITTDMASLRETVQLYVVERDLWLPNFVKWFPEATGPKFDTFSLSKGLCFLSVETMYNRPLACVYVCLGDTVSIWHML